MEKRKELEAEFHNQREFDRQNLSEKEFLKKYPNKKFYIISEKIRRYQEKLILSKETDSKVLDYCCGVGNTSLKLAEMGFRDIYGIDIAEGEIEASKKLLSDNGYGKNGKFMVMDAEKMSFPNDYFDLIIANGVLHHLDIDQAIPELARVLKKDGLIIAMEALGYNPAINLYRKLTPTLRTAWEKDHILTLKELNKAKRYFKRTTEKYFYLVTLLSIPFANTIFFKPILKITQTIDKLLMKIPLLKLMAWQFVFTLSEPKR